MTLLLTYGIISIFFSFLCSILEAVLLSVTNTFIEIKSKEGKSYAETLKKLKQDVDKPLIAILTVNTIAHTVGAILVGVQSEKTFGTGNNMVGIVSAIMTLLILVLSEIIPKTIGATYWKQLANFTSKALLVLIFPLKWTGILWLLQITTKLIGKNQHSSVLSREDFSAMTDLATEKGVFDETESNVIKNLLNFNSVLAKDVMSPKTVVKLASEKDTVGKFFSQNKDLKFSRIPVFNKSSDDITGYVLKDEVFQSAADGNEETKLSELKRNIIAVPMATPVPDLFSKFIETKEHIALIVDEYGATRGVVSMEDVIETLLGLEIIDELDTHADMQQLARQKWEERAKKYGLLKDGK